MSGGAPLALAELESRLWSAANALRGPVDPADFKTYVFPMLFFKWISDSWDYEHAQAVAEYGEDLEPEVEADFHRFNLPKDSHWRDVTTRTDNLGSRINTALARIEQANPDSLARIFGDPCTPSTSTPPSRSTRWLSVSADTSTGPTRAGTPTSTGTSRSGSGGDVWGSRVPPSPPVDPGRLTGLGLVTGPVPRPRVALRGLAGRAARGGPRGADRRPRGRHDRR